MEEKVVGEEEEEEEEAGEEELSSCAASISVEDFVPKYIYQTCVALGVLHRLLYQFKTNIQFDI